MDTQKQTQKLSMKNYNEVIKNPSAYNLTEIEKKYISLFIDRDQPPNKKNKNNEDLLNLRQR